MPRRRRGRRPRQRPATTRCGGASRDGDLGRLGQGEALVAGPLELEAAARGRNRGEHEQRVRRDRGMEIGAEDFLAVVGAGEAVDDVARDHFPELRAAEAGLHGVLDQRADLDDLAALRGGRDVDDRARHQISASSRQAESVTTTCALSDQYEPSLICATASTVPVSASRTRVATRARPERGVKCAVRMFGSGLRSAKTWIALTWLAAVIGLSTTTDSGMELPLSIRGGTSSLTRPGRTCAVPMTWRTASCMAAGVARAERGADASPMPASPAAVARKTRRVTIYSRKVARKATTSSIWPAVSTGLPWKAGATRVNPSVR